MANTLLRTGDIKDFKMLGHDGKAAYLVATQIREMFRVKIGKQYADYLAIPQRNDQGNRVDWYIPFDSAQYDIVPWSSASESEQQSALQLLAAFEQKVVELGKQLANNPNLEGDQLLFSRLIYDPNHREDSQEPNLMAIRFPSNEYIYIVNGKPVITFWGFINPQTQLTQSPFKCLEQSESTAPYVTEQIDPPITSKRPWWKRWWMWLLMLLPLLLLLLLLFLLRGCFYHPESSITPSLSVDNAVNVPVETDRDKKPEDKKGEDPIRDVNVIHRSVGTNINHDSVLNTDNRNDVIGTTVTEGNIDVTDTLNTPTTLPVDSHGAGDDNPPIHDITPDNADTTSDVDNTNQNENQNQNTAAMDTNNATQSQNLSVPPDAIKQGFMDFLNGQWTVGGGIQDKSTGKPLRLNYSFDQGNGEVTVIRSDGVKCVGKVGSGFQNSNLSIKSNTEALCSDNTKYQLPKIECSTNSNNQTDCKGNYNNGTSFPLTMKKQ
ncbi:MULTISPECIES: SrfA family protein [unclassified Gilliamella]|uniref:SrfA family protein n=1 Tax=unclassified Gilliamella TaxID=2685620 RepID=UPI002269D23C|nr:MULTISPECIES: SrfA family protein [unclassified Gilliamella]MCX8587738.1 hypothetical protein [Gilliamella sp. B3801]MCX8591650.1 hypothetical protein [Gilliamella sp. B3804]